MEFSGRGLKSENPNGIQDEELQSIFKNLERSDSNLVSGVLINLQVYR